jgi:hypothetical protein
VRVFSPERQKQRKEELMANSKAVVDYNSMPDGALLNQAKTTHGLLITNAATFPNPPFTMAVFFGHYGALDAAMQAASMGGTDRTATKNAARAVVIDDLGQIATYVNQVANGDPTIIDLSGLPRYSTEHGPSGDVTFVPENVRVEQGNGSGKIVVRWKGDGSKSMYEVQVCTGDPMVEANWSYKGSWTGGKAQLDGFTPGATVWARVRKLSAAGKKGGWSDPAELMVT